MRHYLSRQSLAVGVAALVLLAGCASPPANVKSAPSTATATPDIAVVARTLKTYQPGKTTFDDFKRDAHLLDEPPPAPPRSYLNPDPVSISGTSSNPHYYSAPEGGPWMIFETSEEQTSTTTSSTGAGTSSSTTYSRKYVVGDVKKPICVLVFDQQGVLTGISPVPKPAP